MTRPGTRRGCLRLAARLAREERGFTLAEMMVSIMIMIIVLFALFGLFETGMNVFVAGNNKIEAVENARVGLERMEREVRMAYPVFQTDDTTVRSHLFFVSTVPSQPAPPTSDGITFGNDLDGDRQMEAPGETISYYVQDGNLVRNQGGGLGQIIADLGPTGTLQLSYLGSDADGNGQGDMLCGQSNPTCAGVDEGDIQVVRVRLTIDEGAEGEPRTQVLTTDVELRNRG